MKDSCNRIQSFAISRGRGSWKLGPLVILSSSKSFPRQVWLPRSVGGCQRLVRKRWTSHGWKAIRTRGVSCIPCTSRSSFALPSSLLLSALCKSGRLEGVVRFDRALTARVALAINCESFLFSFLFFSKVADLGNSERARNTYFQQFPPFPRS